MPLCHPPESHTNAFLSLDPVQISFPTEAGQAIAVQPATEQDVLEAMHPSFRKSTIVTSATKASRLLITTTDYVTRAMQSQADSFSQKTQPAAKPMTFTPTTHDRIRRINTYTTKAAGLSAATVGSISKVAQNFGAGMSMRKDGKSRGYDQDGNVIESYKPGMLNKGLMAFNTVVDGMEQAGRSLLTGTSSSVSQVVGHRWGAEAGEVSKHLGGGVRNAGLVYIDVTGVSRRAILKSVAKGMVVGKVKGGGQVIVGGDEDSQQNRAGTGSRGDGATIVNDDASVISDYPRDDKKPPSSKTY